MWMTNSPPIDLADCGSVAVLDSSAVTGRTLQPAWSRFDIGALDVAQDRLLSFMMLATSRLVLNVRRQPKRDLLERTFEAALTTLTLRPPADRGNCATTAASTSPRAIDGSALPPPSSVRTNDALPSPTAASRASSAATELIMVLRDTHQDILGQSAAQPRMSSAQALREWLPGGAADALEAATASWQLMSIPPPTEYDLEMLDGEVELATSFTLALDDAARNLLRRLRPLVPSESAGVADGPAAIAWLEHVVWKLNSQPHAAAHASVRADVDGGT